MDISTQACSTSLNNSSKSVGVVLIQGVYETGRLWTSTSHLAVWFELLENVTMDSLPRNVHISWNGLATVSYQPKVQPSVSAAIAPIIHQCILVTSVRISTFTAEFDVPYRLFETPHDCLLILLEPLPSSCQNCNYVAMYWLERHTVAKRARQTVPLNDSNVTWLSANIRFIYLFTFCWTTPTVSQHV